MADVKTSDEDLILEASLDGTEMIRIQKGANNYRTPLSTLLRAYIKSLPGYDQTKNQALAPDGSGGFKWVSVTSA